MNLCVILDPAHGKNVAGKRSPYSLNHVEPELPFEEYQWSREICTMLAEKLLSAGISFEFSTTSNDEPGLISRMMVANTLINKHTDQGEHCIFISPHVNAAGNGDAWKNARGFAVYTTQGQNNSDKLATAVFDAVKAELAGTDFRFRMDKSDGDVDYEAQFYVIRTAKCPAILTENGFQDNVEDVKLLTQYAIKKKIVDGYFTGILNFARSMGW